MNGMKVDNYLQVFLVLWREEFSSEKVGELLREVVRAQHYMHCKNPPNYTFEMGTAKFECSAIIFKRGSRRGFAVGVT